MATGTGTRLARIRKVGNIVVESDVTQVVQAINVEVNCLRLILFLVFEILEEK